MNNFIEDYYKNGYAVIDDFLPIDIANKLEELYFEENNKWDLEDQDYDEAYMDESESTYGKFKTDSEYLPDPNESFTAKFWRSNNLESKVDEILIDHFKKNLKKYAKSEINNYDMRCYKLDEGCHYRLHMDNPIGDMGFVYYVNKKWKWDWGGILHVAKDEFEEDFQPIFPKFNRVVFMNHTEFTLPHFISQVAKYAKNPRFTLVTFVRRDKNV